MFGLLDGLQLGIGGEGLAAFDHGDRLRVIGQRLQPKPDGREDLAQFDPLLAVRGA